MEVELEKRVSLTGSLDKFVNLMRSSEQVVNAIEQDNTATAANTLLKIQVHFSTLLKNVSNLIEIFFQAMKSSCESEWNRLDETVSASQSEYHQQSAILPLPISQKWDLAKDLYSKLSFALKEKVSHIIIVYD